MPMEGRRKIYIVRSAHHTERYSEDSSEFKETERQLMAAREIFKGLIQRGVSHLFHDGVPPTEAATWNRLINVDWAKYRDLRRRMIKTGLTHRQKDHLEWIAMARDMRQRVDHELQFCGTEPEAKRGAPKDFMRPVMTPGAMPLELQWNYWWQQIANWTTGREIQLKLGFASYLRDKDGFPLIKENAGALNAIYAGSDHQFPDLHSSDSGFEVAAVTLDHNLDFDVTSANTDEKMPELLSKLTQASVDRILRSY